MADHLTLLENKLEEQYVHLRDRIGDARFVKDWNDWNFRAGYLEALRDIGQMIKEVRAPDRVAAEGIADVFQDGLGTMEDMA